MSAKVVRIRHVKHNPAIEMGETEIEVSIGTGEAERAGTVLLDINHPDWCPEPPLRLMPDKAIEIAILLLESARAAQAARDRWAREFPELDQEFNRLLDELNSLPLPPRRI